MAIEQGLQVLGWHENLPKDERPPEYLWEDEQGLELWWEHVAEKQKDGVSTNRGMSDETSDDDRPAMTENDHARFLKNAMA